MSAACEIMEEERLARQRNYVRARAAGVVEGVFGPKSLTWKINREAAILLGGGRSLLLQLAHPFVSTAIAEHSAVLDDPIGRFHRTFALVFTMVFGTMDQAFTAAQRFQKAHAQISGTLKTEAGVYPKGSRYSASDLPARQWVYATLTETALLTYELIFGELSQAERDQYYEESKLFAALCGIPPASLPPDWTGFTTHFEDVVASETLSVTERARIIAHQVLRQVHPWLPVPSWYSGLTTHLLPSRLRHEFGLPYGETERSSAELVVHWVKRLYPLVPDRLRYVGPYQEAVARIEGKDPGFLTGRINRSWLGQSSLSK
jgi:uncharacterized protein (DUF2236 family)